MIKFFSDGFLIVMLIMNMGQVLTVLGIVYYSLIPERTDGQERSLEDLIYIFFVLLIVLVVAIALNLIVNKGKLFGGN